MLKVGLHAQMLGIAAGNRLTISPTRTIHVKRIVNCFSHYRISSDAVVTWDSWSAIAVVGYILWALKITSLPDNILFNNLPSPVFLHCFPDIGPPRITEVSFYL